jgi:hypothetical protein
MKKGKLKLDSAAVQSFFVHHVEKIVLVVVMGVMAWLVYAGYSLPGLEAGKTPSGLKQVSTSTRQFIDDPQRWANDVAPERRLDGNLVELVTAAQKDTDPTRFFLPQPLSPPNFPKLSPRLDPELFAPQRLEVEPFVAALASYPRSMEEMDPLYQAPPDPAEVKKPPVRRPKTNPMDDYAYGPAGSSSDPGYGASGSSGYGRGRRAPRARGRSGSSSSSGPGGAASYPDAGPGGSSASGPGSMYSGGGPGSMMSGTDGYSSGGMYGMAGGGGLINPESIRGFQTSDQMAIGRHTGGMVIKAVVPFEKQAEVFLNSLGNSLDYDPQRDQPMYLGFRVERAEIPADNLDADPTPLWKSIPVLATLDEQIGTAESLGTWAGVLSEVVDPNYLDPKLTHPAPPVMQRDVWGILTHADVPLATQALSSYGNEEIMFPGAKPKEGEKRSDNPDDPGFGPGFGAAGGYGASMDGSGSGYGPSGYGSSGYGGAAGSRPGMGLPRPGGMMSGGPGGMMSGGSRSSGPSSGTGYGAYGSSGSGDMYGYGGMAMAPPKYKLIRFTDTTVEAGKYYRYRVCVLLHDPNHPYATMVPPTLGSLDPEVRTRVLKLDAEDAAKPKYPDGRPFRTFWKVSDWSEPSQVVSLPSTSEYYVGTVDQPAYSEIVPGKPKVPSSQPKAKVLTNVWDATKVVDVPAEVEVYRGSILNFVQDAKVIHPITHEVVPLDKYAFKTDAIVADLAGGEEIPPLDRKNDKPLLAPGEMLVFDAQGNLHVQDETDDVESFRRLLLPKPEENKTGVGPDGSSLPESGAEGYGGYDEMMLGPAAGSRPSSGRSGGPGGRGSSGGPGSRGRSSPRGP